MRCPICRLSEKDILDHFFEYHYDKGFKEC